MDDKIIEVSFDSLLELDYYNLLAGAVKETPDSVDDEPLIYDEHRTLMVAAFVAKDFLKLLHFPEKLESYDQVHHITLYTIYWVDLMKENIIGPNYPGFPAGEEREEPKDTYLKELMEEIEFKGYKNPKEYPLLTYIGGSPYVPVWHALKWGKKALRMLGEMLEAGGESNV